MSFRSRLKKRSGLMSGDQAATAMSSFVREASVSRREERSIFWNQAEGISPLSSAFRQRGKRCTAW